MKEFDGELNKATAFFTDQDEDVLTEQLIEVFEANGIAYKVSDKSRKITFTRVKETEGEIQEGAEMQVELLNYNNE